MSLQQNNKVPKHLQHVRLQKEEEEEQWISGEELCTEGSSDEETTNDIKKRFKSKLNQPSKDYLLKKSVSNASSLKSDGAETGSSENSQISLENWRPKKGSIKLPKIDDKTLDFELEICKTEDNYNEVIREFESFKNELNLENDNLDENNNTSEFDVVLSLDNELEKMDHLYQEYKKKRLDFQTEVCEKIKTLSCTTLELKSTKSFHDLFKYKSDVNIHREENYMKPKVEPKLKLPRVKNVSRKNRIVMEDLLSDKDKERLNLLLSDIEDDSVETENDVKKTDENIETEVDEIQNEIVDREEMNENNLKDSDNEDTKKIPMKNAFKKTSQETNDLTKIEKKLKTLQEMCNDADLQGKLSQEFSIIDEENREWKAYLKLTQERFHRIDEKINKLHEMDEQGQLKEDDSVQKT